MAAALRDALGVAMSRCRLMVALAGLGAMASSAMAIPEVEPNDSAAQANLVTYPLLISAMSDGQNADWFRFTLTQPTRIRVEANADAGMCTQMDLVVEVFAAGNPAQVVMSDDDSGPGLCSLIDPADPNYPTLAPGDYLVRVYTLNSVTQPYTLMLGARAATPMTQAFTYQGVVKGENGQPLNGWYDVTVSLWSDPFDTSLMNRLSLPVQYQNVEVRDGLMTLPNIDFVEDVFDGNERFLQIEVAESGQAPFVTFERTKLSAAPMASFALKTGTAESATHAQTADSATIADHAGNATYASQAGSATTASSAQSVGWSGVTGKPAGFADGVDNEGPWSETAGGGHVYVGQSTTVGIGTQSVPAGCGLAVYNNAAKAGGGSWAVFCDERLKQDITPLNGTLDKLLALHGYSFEYTPEALKRGLVLPGTQVGLKAQEVERVFPDWVSKDEDGYLYVTERATTALMVEALRDLRAEKDAADAKAAAKLDALAKENAELKARLERLEAAVERTVR